MEYGGQRRGRAARTGCRRVRRPARPPGKKYTGRMKTVPRTKSGWEYRLSVTNLTDERNLAPPNGTYGLEGILVLPGTQAEFTVAYSF